MKSSLSENRYSIRYKLSISFFLLMLVFSIVNAAFWSFKTSDYIEVSTVDYVNELVRISNKEFERALIDIYGVISLTAMEKAVQIDKLLNLEYSDQSAYLNDRRELEHYIFSLWGGARKYLSGIIIYNLEGKGYNFGVSSNYEFRNIEQEVKEWLDSGKQKLLKPPYDETTCKNGVFSIITPVKVEGRTTAIIVGNLWCSLLIDMFDVNIKYGGTVAIVDENTGKLIFKPDDNKLDDLLNDEVIDSIVGNTRGEKGDFYTTVSGQEVLVTYLYSEFTNWTTVGIIPRDHLMKEYDRSRRTAVIYSIYFAAIGLAVAFIITSFHTKNIKKFYAAIAQTGENNLDIDIKIDSNDEIGALYRQYQKMLRRIKNLLEDIRKTEHEKRMTEIQVLQAQINPHFLYNTLNTIKFLSSMQGADNIKEVTESLSDLLYIYMSKDKLFLTVEEEMKYVNSYLQIQGYKYSGKFSYDFVLEEGIERYAVFKLMLQPIVENALIHGIAPLKDRPGHLLIKAVSDNHKLIITVRDNGAGIPKDKLAGLTLMNQGQIGLRNIDKRVKMYFGDAYGVSIESEENHYTVVELTLPLLTIDEVNGND